MSDRRRFRWDSGRLGRGPIQDFWQVSLTVQDPSIPNLPLETPTSGGAYSLTADAGALTLTGQAASLARGLVVGATGGAYALSVGAADLASWRQVVATGGAYGLSVGDAGLTATRTIPADGATITLTVSDASLDYVPVSSGGWIFKREKYFRDAPPDVDEPPKPKKSKRATLKVIKRVAKRAVEENRVFDVSPLLWAFQRERIDYSEHLEQIYWRIVKAEIERQKREDDEEAILLML